MALPECSLLRYPVNARLDACAKWGYIDCRGTPRCVVSVRAADEGGASRHGNSRLRPVALIAPRAAEVTGPRVDCAPKVDRREVKTNARYGQDLRSRAEPGR